MKRCFKCLCEKPLADFYAHAAMGDGHLNKCKECTKRDARQHRQDKLEHIRQYDRARASQPHRAALAKRLLETYRASHPERVRANRVVARELRAGRLMRLPCEVCGNEKTVAHHSAYDMPLAVTWLCQPHHTAAHAATKECSTA